MDLQNALRTIPLLLTALRALLAPVMVALALSRPSMSSAPFMPDTPSMPAFGACLIAAFLSDVFDGIMARRLGIATPRLRRLDSLADSLFYASAAFAAWHLYPRAFTERLAPLAPGGSYRYRITKEGARALIPRD